MFVHCTVGRLRFIRNRMTHTTDPLYRGYHNNDVDVNNINYGSKNNYNTIMVKIVTS